MSPPVGVCNAYWQGATIVFVLGSVEDKKAVYKCVKNLKGVKAEVGKRFQLNDHLPEALREVKEKQKQTQYLNKLQPEPQLAEITFEKGTMKVNNVVYTNLVPRITARDLLSLTDADMARLE